MAMRACSLLTPVRSEATNSNSSPPAPPPNPNPNPFFPRPSFTSTFSKRSMVIRTESNIRREVQEKPDPPCVVCKGSGKVYCRNCKGQGRTNCVHLVMLPKGEWPKWCRVCGGSGLSHCNRCTGTGEYRGVMGFLFDVM